MEIYKYLLGYIYIYIYIEIYIYTYIYRERYKYVDICMIYMYDIYMLNASWTHGLIAQSVRAAECNSVVVGSNPTKANFLYLLRRILQWWIPHVSTHSATLMWLPQQKFHKNKRGKWRRHRPKWNVTLN